MAKIPINFSQILSTFSSSFSPMIKRAVGFNLSFINPNTAFQSYIETCGSLFKACPHHNPISSGQALHGHVIKMGISSDRFIAIKLLIMYLNCKKSIELDKIFREIDGFDIVAWNCMISAHAQVGNFEEACRLFDEMPDRNAVSWTALIAGFMKFGKIDDAIWYFERNPFQNVVSWTATISGLIRNGSNFKALVLFRRMFGCGIAPNEITFTSVVRACASVGNFRLGRNVLGLIVKTGFECELSVCNSLITFHLRMGDIDLARHVFYGMEERDVVSWTAILDVYVEMGELREARRIFDEMPDRNEVSWSAMIARYSQNDDFEEALELFYQMVQSGFKPNISCFSSVLSALASLEALQLGKNVHGHVIKTGIEDNVYIGSPLIDMYCKCGKTKDGRRIFDLISERNIVSWNSMVAGYSYNDEFEEAMELFEQIPTKNVVSWNALITGYVQNEHCEKVFDVFDDMLLSGTMPNESTFSSVLRACASLASCEKGKNLHGKIVKLGMQYDVFMGTALTDMYAKSGDIKSSKRVFDRMPEKNEISWTAMIQGLADNGLAEESLVRFEQMKGTTVNPTEFTFLGVLFACSHCGLVDKGFEYFESMKSVYGINPRGRHYTCMVDLLARAGHLSEAEEFIKTMPFQPEANAWAALLSACSKYGNEEIGERIAGKLWELAKENSAGYILLSNIYASARRWNDVSKVRRLMRDKGLKKCGGCSWIEVRNQINTFFVGDECHPESANIYGILELLMAEMIV
ncbi:pentatricopeptide repeat-containing protein At2g13600-like [Tasmannia lanceolata]|uniref:pentatricopeptide repeat-containing protein At2g13600-like n=1 Tax=Tasmannia lanceolata TaxID=3420 RepID=UPI004063055D